MPIKTVEAQLVLGGKDTGAAAAVMQVVKAYEQAEKASKGVSKGAEQVAKALLDVEKQQKALDAVMGAQRGVTAAETGLTKLRTGAATAAAALDKARTAFSAFEGQKPTRGSEMAAQMSVAAKALATAERAQKSATREVEKGERALEQQTRALREHERVATAAAVPLKALEQHQKHLAATYDQTSDALRRQIRLEGEATRAAQHHAREQAEAARHMRQHGAIGLAAGAAAGAVSAHSVVHHTTDALKAGARLQHETVALRNAGRTDAELAQIERASRETIRAVPTATFEENLKVVNETVSAFGSLDHALEHLTFMQKASAAVHAAAGGKITDSAGEMGNKLARFAEERGSAMDGHRFQRETEGLVRAMVFSGGNFNPHEAINFAQQAKSSLRGYNEEFLTLYMPSIVGTMKGERAGTAANAFNNVINGKVNDKKQAEEWMKYGLLDTRQAIMKGGHAVAWRAGAVKGTNLAHQNPVEWMEKVVLPALKAKGVDIDNDDEVSKVFATMFRGTTGNFFANEVGLKSFRNRLHKDADLQKQVGSLDDIYNRNIKQDPTEGVKAVKAGLEDLMAAATNPLMLPAAAGLKALAEGLQGLALMAKDHPMLAASAGGAAAAGGLAVSGYASYKIATGFGLPAAAGELTIAAKALDAAAVKLGTGGGGGGLPGSPGEAPGKGGKLKSALRFGVNAFGAIGLGPLAEAAQGKHIFEMPDVGKDGWLRSGLNFLDPNGGNAVLGPAGEQGPQAKGLPPRAHPHMIDAEAVADPYAAFEERRGREMIRRDAASAAGKEAGEKAGEGIKTGIREKAPEVVDQAQSLFDAISRIFKQGIAIPLQMSFDGSGMGGGGDGLIQRASFGGGSGGLGSIPGMGGASGGSGGAGSGFGGGYRRALGGGGGGGGPSGPMPGIPASVEMTDAERNMLGLIQLHESHGRNTLNYVGTRQGLDPMTARGATAQGYFQILNSNWRRLAPGLGIKTRNAMSSTLEEQTRVALALLRASGGNPKDWAPFNPALRAAIRRGDRAPPGAVAGKDPAGLEPRLVRGLDGKEGLDQGDGTMKMPDGSIRSITNGGGPPRMPDRTVPDAPRPGIGGHGAMGDHVAELGRHIDRLADAEMRVHATFEVNAGTGLTAKAKRIRSHSDGPLRGNVGVSMPQTEIG